MLHKKIVRKHLRYTRLWPLLMVITLAGCDSINTSTDIQDIVEIKWQPDGSAIYGFMQKLTLSQYQTYPSASYTVTKFNMDGTFNKSLPTDQQAVTDISFSIYLSATNPSLITQVGSDLYQINTSTNAYSKLYELFHLLVVSPDQHYAVGSVSPPNRPVKTVVVADLTVQPARIVSSFDLSGITQEPGIWVGNGRYAITLADSLKTHVTVFDTSGTVIGTIGGAEVAFHNSAFIASTNMLYVRNQAQQKNDGSVDKINLSTMQRTNVLPQSVESFDVSQDDGLMVFNQYIPNADSSQQTLTMFAKNLVNGNQSQLTNDVLSLVSLSPAADHVAYIHMRDVNYNEIYVKSVARP